MKQKRGLNSNAELCAMNRYANFQLVSWFKQYLFQSSHTYNHIIIWYRI